jgi:hypothetical protein
MGGGEGLVYSKHSDKLNEAAGRLELSKRQRRNDRQSPRPQFSGSRCESRNASHFRDYSALYESPHRALRLIRIDSLQ